MSKGEETRSDIYTTPDCLEGVFGCLVQLQVAHDTQKNVNTFHAQYLDKLFSVAIDPELAAILQTKSTPVAPYQASDDYSVWAFKHEGQLLVDRCDNEESLELRLGRSRGMAVISTLVLVLVDLAPQVAGDRAKEEEFVLLQRALGHATFCARMMMPRKASKAFKPTADEQAQVVKRGTEYLRGYAKYDIKENECMVVINEGQPVTYPPFNRPTKKRARVVGGARQAKKARSSSSAKARSSAGGKADGDEGDTESDNVDDGSDHEEESPEDHQRYALTRMVTVLGNAGIQMPVGLLDLGEDVEGDFKGLADPVSRISDVVSQGYDNADQYAREQAVKAVGIIADCYKSEMEVLETKRQNFNRIWLKGEAAFKDFRLKRS